MGRPTDYKPEYCDLVIEHMATGLSFESFAGLVRASKQTIYDWANKNPEFLDAKDIGFELNRLYWEKMGRDHITHTDSKFESTPKLNSSVYIFNLKNRFPKEWRDRTESAVDVKIDSKQLESMTDGELADLLERAQNEFKRKNG